ncbi:class I SAM-dependent methyltransferase [Actinokineospora diospyrosa]|uniref:Methyltransferase domain-containing protein n=1 Tax=Actinokineospora diospyrosa TaxID=103728 RepID=A0ABT1IHF5_9PSEU|nr:class I SAM-dependent methyltransferase [Actinokineospora diospyrosa]MCP2271998.1 Methyltransferase domain-containing protein [Actinokineospora diospyrosa]
MTPRKADGSAGDADYGDIGTVYTGHRNPDPRIAAAITAAIGDARSVLNVGAGAGSYEPLDRDVTAVEPSASMRALRPASRPAVDATAEALPFPDAAFDAAMATFTVHQWSDLAGGLAELRRVTRGPVVLLTADPDLVRDFWLYEYAPEVLDVEARRYPAITDLASGLGGGVRVDLVPIPNNCVDGFNEAYYGRPEKFLDPTARQACSAWSFVDGAVADRFATRLEEDLADGTWDRKYGQLRNQPTYAGSLILVTSHPAATDTSA